MEMKLVWGVLSAFFIIGGYISLNDSLNAGFIKWTNARKGVKNNITKQTLSASKSLGYFLLTIGVVFGLIALFT